jgi:hypothetical protein
LEADRLKPNSINHYGTTDTTYDQSASRRDCRAEVVITFRKWQERMSFIKLFSAAILMTLALSLAGCNSSSSSNSSSGPGMDAMAGAMDAQDAARKKQDQDAAGKAAADQQAAAAQAAQNPPPPERKAVGSRPQMEGGGYFRAIGSARRHVMNVVDNLSWIQGVRSFKAEEGRKPKNNDEFMNVVVKRYDLQLPRIEEDEEYLYDPNGESDGDFGQLFVVKQQTAAADPAAPATPAPAQ